MGVTTVKASNDGSWPNARAVPSGHWVAYFPQARVLVAYDAAGAKVAEQPVPSGVRDFDAYLAAGTGELIVHFADYNNDQSPWPWKRWSTGVLAGAAPPPPAPGGNATIVNQMRALLDKIV